MRLFCDANIGTRIAKLLAAAGHDVVRSIHVLGQHADDGAIIAEAVRDTRILITSDADFGELVFMSGARPPPAIVYVRFRPSRIEDVAPRILAALDLEGIEGHMIVIGRSDDRKTRFPGAP